MKESIQAFIDQKRLSHNSRQAYFYDLTQFCELIEGPIDAGSLVHYQGQLARLKTSVQQRKVSAVNQFLHYLYEEGQLERFYKLKVQSLPPLPQAKKTSQDLSILWEETDFRNGQLIALLISQLGLTPSEIAQIQKGQIDFEFRILTIDKQGQKRILSLPKELLPYLERQGQGPYLFDKKGLPYSRQWFFKQLSTYVGQLGHSDWTAQFLREQWILKQVQTGKSLEEIAKKLGLKTRTTLEKYI